MPRWTLDLPGCPSCREELAAYAGLPGLMSRLSLAQIRQPRPTVPPPVLKRTLAAVADEHGTQVTQLRRWRGAAVLSTAAAVIVAALLGVTVSDTGNGVGPPATVPLIAAAGVSASGSAALQAKPWGTAVTLQLHGLPDGDGYTAWVTSADGRRTIAATWSPTPDGQAAVTGATGITQTNLASLQVDQAGHTLLTLSSP